MTGILMSVKARVKPSSKVSVDIDASKLLFFLEDYEGKTGYHRPWRVSLVIWHLAGKDGAGNDMAQHEKLSVEPKSLDVGEPKLARPSQNRRSSGLVGSKSMTR
jgi:hypothetical protein